MSRGVRWPTVRKLVLGFPGTSEGTSYGSPAFLLDGKFFSRFNEKEQGLVVYVEEGLRDALLEGKPGSYFTTDHYAGYPMLLVRLERVPRAELETLLEGAFLMRAKPKRLDEYEARASASRRKAPRGASLPRSGRSARGPARAAGRPSDSDAESPPRARPGRARETSTPRNPPRR
jgi:hypothetical protein